MVDWDRVERLRSKGRHWKAIAADPKVHFAPSTGTENPGKALKAQYYERKSQTHVPAHKAPVASVRPEHPETPPLTVRTALVPAGLAVTIAGALWFLFALGVPQAGLIVPAIPYVALVAAAGAVVLLVGLALHDVRLSRAWKRPVAVGLVLGLVIPGLLAAASGNLGLPNLTTAFPEPVGQGWLGTDNAVWKGGNGLPVFMVIGSVACPYCAASSWAFQQALDAFGALSGGYSSRSESGYIYSETPEVALDASSLSGHYISWDPRLASDDQNIHLPSLSSVESAYYSYYHPSSGIPFLVVVGGVFLHTTQLVDPGCLFNGGCGCDYTSGGCGSALSYATVQSDIASGTGSVFSAIHQGTIYLEACMVRSDQLAGVTPPSLPSDVMSIVPSLTG
jgi:hypothetical protein